MEAWLAADLSRQSGERKLILVTHDKPRVFPGNEPYAPLLDQFARHPGALLALHGHHHTTTVFRRGDVTVAGVPTLCFGGIDTSPRGYTAIKIEDRSVQLEVRPLPAPGRSAAFTPVGKARSLPRLPLPASLLWTAKVGTTLHRAAPTLTGGKAIFSLGDRFPASRCGLAAFDLGRGTMSWNCPTEATVKNSATGDEKAGCGYAAEVTGRLFRFELETGKLVWSRELPHFPDRYLYASPLVTSDAVFLVQHKGLTAHDPITGKILWARGPAWDDNRSAVYQRPVSDRENLFFLQTPFMGEYGVEACGRRDGRRAWWRPLHGLSRDYAQPLFQSHFPSPLLAGDLLVVPGLADRLAVLDCRPGRPAWELPVLRREGPAAPSILRFTPSSESRPTA